MDCALVKARKRIKAGTEATTSKFRNDMQGSPDRAGGRKGLRRPRETETSFV